MKSTPLRRCDHPLRYSPKQLRGQESRLDLKSKAMPMGLAILASLAVALGFSTAVAHADPPPTHYVNLSNPTPAPPYTNWATAATRIQDAVDVALAGDLVLVTNGVYATGGRAVYGTMTNRVAITNALRVESVNGPQFTIIAGANGYLAVRGVYLADGALLSGFTLTNGATRNAGDSVKEQSGGGVWCASTNSVLTNCVLAGNAAYYWGGGARGGTLSDCTLSNNSSGLGGGVYQATLNNCTIVGNSAAVGGGAELSTLNNCTLSGNSAWADYSDSYGGGASSCTLSNCTLSSNSAGTYGGGSSYSTLSKCVLTGNSAAFGGGSYYDTLNNCTLSGNGGASGGGGAYWDRLNNCTLSGNSSEYGGGSSESTLNNCTLSGNSARSEGGGSYDDRLNNCIVYYNTAPLGHNWSTSTLNYCCTTPLPDSGTGNISTEPQLASASHLSGISPCIRAGLRSAATGTDIDGEPWANPPSIGCDEYYSGSVTGALDVAISLPSSIIAAGFSVELDALITGRLSASRWDFGDGTIVSNRPYATHAWATVGDYPVVLTAYNETFPGGVSATQLVHVVSGVYYVAANSPNPVPPYSDWTTAASDIQAAVDAATPFGARVVVSNGVYATGGRAVYGTMTNRVAITNALRVESVNGPQFTVIVGVQVAGTTNGNGAIRCVYLADGAVLSGFTLTNGATSTTGDADMGQSGGGVWCVSTNAFLTNCVLTGNVAGGSGGGACRGTLNNCILTRNSALNGGGASDALLNNCSVTGNSARSNGGGVYDSTPNNCTLIGNSATSGGGSYNSYLHNCALSRNSARTDGGGAYAGSLYNCTLTGNSARSHGGGTAGGGYNSSYLLNCIIYYNTAAQGSNWSGATLNWCCTTPLPASGTGNVPNEPQLASISHLRSGSPCIGAGSATYAMGTDIDGEPWANPPSIGCDEYYSGSVTGALDVAISLPSSIIAAGFSIGLDALTTGRLSASRWDFGDGAIVSNQIYVAHAWAAPGDYPVVLTAYNETFPGGVSATQVVHVVNAVHYVALNSLNPVPPYGDWTTAASNIQAAVDAATIYGARVVVSNGVYAAGGRAVYGTVSNRLVIAKALRVESVSGPQFTVIAGSQPAGLLNPSGAMRCVYLADGAILSGFTLTNGATGAAQNDIDMGQSGGGAWCASINAVLTNCALVGNQAYWLGGGAYYGTLNNCILSANAAGTNGGGACYSLLSSCTLSNNTAICGGGAYASALNYCTLSANFARYGGGAYTGTLDHCTLSSNLAWYGVGTNVGSFGGGAYNSALTSCTLSSNSATYGGGAYNGTLSDSILSGNSASQGGGTSYSVLSNCTFSSNSAYELGGAVQGGTLNHCTLGTNSAGISGGGASWATLNDCILTGNSAWSGGGSYRGALSNCTLSGNSAYLGGGDCAGSLINCTLTSNSADADGGGTYSSLLSKCTLTGNSADGNGGGTYAGSLTNCTLSSNSAGTNGGGASGATLAQCVLSDNDAFNGGGGAERGTLYGCLLTGNLAYALGGGAMSNVLWNCTLSNNWALGEGGGAFQSTVNESILIHNLAGDGGGAWGGTLINCLLTANSAQFGGGTALATNYQCTVVSNSAEMAGGVNGGGAVNSIVWDNTAQTAPNYSAASISYCCTTPLPTGGAGNITNAPLFQNPAGGDYRLDLGSPGIDAGNNSLVMSSIDLDGNPRIVGAAVDMGAYEYPSPNSIIPYAWLRQYGLATDGSADFADPDHDGMNNWQEWMAGTDPTNALSALKMLVPTNRTRPLVISWQSVAGKIYTLERSTNLAIPYTFLAIQSNIAGQANTTSFADTTATNAGPYFYRVRIQQ